jgi:hypothetical protein
MDKDTDKVAQLSPMEEAFCQSYCAPGTETYRNGTRSAVAAGYSEISAASQASRMLRKDKVQRRMLEIEQANLASAADKATAGGDDEGVPQDLATVRVRLHAMYVKAKDEGDNSSAIRALDLLGETFEDEPDQAAIRELSERESRIAEVFAAFMLDHPEWMEYVDTGVGSPGVSSGRGIVGAAAEPQQQAGQAGNVPEGGGAPPA